MWRWKDCLRREQMRACLASSATKDIRSTWIRKSRKGRGIRMSMSFYGKPSRNMVCWMDLSLMIVPQEAACKLLNQHCHFKIKHISECFGHGTGRQWGLISTALGGRWNHSPTPIFMYRIFITDRFRSANECKNKSKLRRLQSNGKRCRPGSEGTPFYLLERTDNEYLNASASCHKQESERNGMRKSKRISKRFETTEDEVVAKDEKASWVQCCTCQRWCRNSSPHSEADASLNIIFW